jgi:hypothetical protein
VTSERGWPVAKVYVLQHSNEMAGGVEDVKLIGVYSSRESAQAAVGRLGRLPGFADSVGRFSIDEYQLDRDQWVEGYLTVASA